MKRYSGLHKIGQSDLQKIIAALDRDVSKMVLERDEKEGCIDCGVRNCQFDNGHFRIRQNMSTRFHPMNCNKQATKCNRFGSKTFEYGLALDKKYGKGCALFLEKLSRKVEQWSVEELQQLRSAAKMGARAYEQVFYELRKEYEKSSGKNKNNESIMNPAQQLRKLRTEKEKKMNPEDKTAFYREVNRKSWRTRRKLYGKSGIKPVKPNK